MRRLSTARLFVIRALTGCSFAITAANSWAMDEVVPNRPASAKVVVNPQVKAQPKQYEYAVFKKHCTQCHESVADPEKPGKDRDEWYRIINLMESHGLSINQDEADMIVDLLYALRRGPSPHY